MTILSYKTIIGPTFSVILQNLMDALFRKVPKTLILGQNGHFSARLAKFGQHDNFFPKRSLLYFYPYCSQTTACLVS